MHWQKSVTSDQHQHNQNRPYLGVRVKEPVKELLKRKRGNLGGSSSVIPTAPVDLRKKCFPPEYPFKCTVNACSVFMCRRGCGCRPQLSICVPTSYQTHPQYTSVVSNTTELPYVDLDATTSLLPIQDEGTFYTGWISQPSSFQPITQWTTCPEYISHETVSCPYTGDMYVQPMCQGYTVVGPPSVLTYTSQPLLTNFTARNTTPCVATPIEYAEQQTPLTYFPWAQTIPSLPTATHSIPYQATPTTIPSQQFVPIPIAVSDSVPQELDEPRRDINNVPIEKLLQGEEGNDAYVLHHTLPIESL